VSGGVAWRRALAVCGAVVLVDQATKAIVVSSLAVGQRESLLLGLDLTNTTNRGLAFGIGGGRGFVLATTIVALAAVLAWFAVDPRRPGRWLSVGLLAGGALGNLADRVRADAVTASASTWSSRRPESLVVTSNVTGADSSETAVTRSWT
jgi:signal peptidase II